MTAVIVTFVIMIAYCCETSVLFLALFCLWVLEKRLSNKWHLNPVMNISDILDSSISIAFWWSFVFSPYRPSLASTFLDEVLTVDGDIQKS